MKTILKVSNVGQTILGQPIERWDFTSNHLNSKKYLLVAGVHGNEYEGIELIQTALQNTYLQYIKRDISLDAHFSFIPILNKDGFILNTRSNCNDIDLNRNIPTSNWSPNYKNSRYKPGPYAGSEPETKAFLKTIDQLKPDLIISLHSFEKSLLLYNSINGEYDNITNQLAEELKIPVVDKMDYEITGSLNNLGKETSTPILTIEAPRGNEWLLRKNQFQESFINFLNKLQNGKVQ